MPPTVDSPILLSICIPTFNRARILRDSALSYCLAWSLQARARLRRLLGRSV